MRNLAAILRMVALSAAFFGFLMAAFAVLTPQFSGTYGAFIVNVEASEMAGLPLWARTLVLVIPSGAFAYAMLQLAGLLQLTARGEVFSAPAASYLRRCGVWLLLTTLAGKLLPFVAQGLNLWLSNAAHGEVSLAMSSKDVWDIFVSALFMLVARVLSDAYRIAEENRQII